MTSTINNEDTVVTTSHPFEGLANGDERLAKVKLAHQINQGNCLNDFLNYNLLITARAYHISKLFKSIHSDE